MALGCKSRLGASVLVSLLAACSSGSSSSDSPSLVTMSTGAVPAGSGGSMFGTGGVAPLTGGIVEATGGVSLITTGGVTPIATGGVASTGGMAATGGVAATGGDMTPVGPDDGDPNAPVVSTTDVTCGGSPGIGIGNPNFQLDSRDMIVTYPCNKHAGAPMTFILNLHGTSPVAQHFYEWGYFSIDSYTSSHNFIVVTPSSVVEQWGNGDNGQDEPHLMHIIDWVYATFNGPDKFDIRAMWVAGHSWGAMYSTTFVCKSYLTDKAKGAVLMSGSGTNPTCASSISVISTTAENDLAGISPVDQGLIPASHGCGDPQMSMIGNNNETYWPNCNPGFTHANYLMLGKGHTDFLDIELVARIADLIKMTRL